MCLPNSELYEVDDFKISNNSEKFNFKQFQFYSYTNSNTAGPNCSIIVSAYSQGNKVTDSEVTIGFTSFNPETLYTFAIPTEKLSYYQDIDTVDIQYVDGSPMQIAFANFSYSINAPKQNPTIGNLEGDTVDYIEDGGAVKIDQELNAIVEDVDSSDFNGGRLSVSIENVNSTEDMMELEAGGGITLSGNNVAYNGNLIGTYSEERRYVIIVFNTSDATAEAVSAALKQISYNNTNSTNPDTTPR